jgi:hypothetical protein
MSTVKHWKAKIETWKAISGDRFIIFTAAGTSMPVTSSSVLAAKTSEKHSKSC